MGHHWDRAGGDTVSGVIGLVQGGDTMVALLGWVRGDDTVVVSPRRIGGELCGLVEMRLGLLLCVTAESVTLVASLGQDWWLSQWCHWGGGTGVTLVTQLGWGMSPLGQGWGHHSGVTARWRRSVTLAALLACCEMRLPCCPHGALSIPIPQARHCATVTSTRAGCPPTSSTAARWPLLPFALG